MPKYYKNINEALERIRWRFQKGGWKTNLDDLNAFNVIVEYVNNQRALNVNQNIPFAKLFIWAYADMLKKYNATVFDNIPQKAVSKMLDRDLEEYYQRFTQMLNDSENYLRFRSLFPEKEDKGYLTRYTEKEIKEQIKKISPKQQKEAIQNVWELEDVKNQLNLMIAEALNRFNK